MRQAGVKVKMSNTARCIKRLKEASKRHEMELQMVETVSSTTSYRRDFMILSGVKLESMQCIALKCHNGKHIKSELEAQKV